MTPQEVKKIQNGKEVIDLMMILILSLQIIRSRQDTDTYTGDCEFLGGASDKIYSIQNFDPDLTGG